MRNLPENEQETNWVLATIGTMVLLALIALLGLFLIWITE